MTRVKDVNRIPDLIKQLKSLESYKVQLGIVAPSGDKMYMVARVHEYGVDIPVTDKMRGWFLAQGMPLKKGQVKITIPERSYFRSGWDSNKASISNKVEKAIGDLMDGNKTAYDLRGEIGDYASKKIRDNVQSVGLVDTGDLRDSIGFKVVPR